MTWWIGGLRHLERTFLAFLPLTGAFRPSVSRLGSTQTPTVAARGDASWARSVVAGLTNNPVNLQGVLNVELMPKEPRETRHAPSVSLIHPTLFYKIWL